jgi:hypothetical protein
MQVVLQLALNCTLTALASHFALYDFGGTEKYGYQGLRIYRHVLIDTLVAALKEKGISVVYGRKYSQVISEDEAANTSGGVTFAFTDGTTKTASLLVGADGIHSTVRRHPYPDLETTFLGMAGIMAAVPTAQLQPPADGSYYIPVTIASKNKERGGAFVIVPQNSDGGEVLIGKQRRILEHERVAWEQRGSVADGRAAAVAFLQEGADNDPEIVANAVAQTDPAKINVWPFYVVPQDGPVGVGDTARDSAGRPLSPFRRRPARASTRPLRTCTCWLCFWGGSGRRTMWPTRRPRLISGRRTARAASTRCLRSTTRSTGGGCRRRTRRL